MLTRRQPVYWFLALTLTASFGGGASAEPRFAGIWEGVISYRPAEMEIEVLVELGRDAEGNLVGTTDIDTLHMKYHLLEGVEVDGRKISFYFVRDSERHGPDTHFVFSGEVDADGKQMRGTFTDGDKEHPFELRWAAEAGSPRREPVEQPLTVLSDNHQELRERFNQDAEHVRLVLLLSPT